MQNRTAVRAAARLDPTLNARKTLASIFRLARARAPVAVSSWRSPPTPLPTGRGAGRARASSAQIRQFPPGSRRVYTGLFHTKNIRDSYWTAFDGERQRQVTSSPICFRWVGSSFFANPQYFSSTHQYANVYLPTGNLLLLTVNYTSQQPQHLVLCLTDELDTHDVCVLCLKHRMNTFVCNVFDMVGDSFLIFC